VTNTELKYAVNSSLQSRSGHTSWHCRPTKLFIHCKV